ncbi:P-loop NTPase fold protein [Trebonia kvetii]|uniref:P-loop NTPase fold protein n=1 Tax=Trebonia kvetii TaxID=2480626 RepID=UPI001652912E|nr:P-loop NTPase fold protein [Trebonia kvetii]
MSRETDAPPVKWVSALFVREDESLAEALWAGLTSRRIPFPDAQLASVDRYNTTDQIDIDAATVVLAVCSPASIQDVPFLDQAKRAYGRTVAVTLGDVSSLPGEFGNIEPFDLSGWLGDTADPRLDELARALISALAEREAPAIADGSAATADSQASFETEVPSESETPPTSGVSSASGERVPDMLDRAVELLPGGAGEAVRFSDSAANVLRLSGQTSGDATAVFLIALSNAPHEPGSNVSSALRGVIASEVPDDLGALLRDLTSGLPARTATGGDDPPPAFVALLGDALGYADAVSGRPEIHTRHLLAAAALANDQPIAGAVLDALHLSRAQLCRLLFEVISQFRGIGRVRAWHDLLLASLTGGISTDRVDPNEGIARDLDALDFSVWTSMFADVIADRNTDANLPLSIGLFGAWGSGKSYFMGLLRSEIDSRCGRPGYVRDVVHVGFNAWHYADSNLWASLGDEIFRKLMDELASKAGEQKEILREEIAAGLVATEELRTRQKQATAETQRYAREADQARAARQAGTRELLTAMAGSAELRGYLNKAWRFLGVSDQAEQADLLARQLGGERQDAVVLRGLLGKRSTVLIAAVCLIALLVTIAGAIIPARWGARLFGAGGLSTIALVLGWAVTLARRVNGGLAALRTAAVKAAGENDVAIREAESNLRKAQADEKAAMAQVDHSAEHVADLQRRLDALDPAQQAYAFLAERAASRDYASQLGLVSTIRKDLLHLVRVLKNSRGAVGAIEALATPANATPANATPANATPANAPAQAARDIADAHAIDRIVLYIDDLDRCRPRQVVEVLEAVHLLLALDLFVVVVGVDPRWLLRSLREQYPGLLDAGTRSVPGGNAHSDATTADYLEKIFNIPFVLPGFPAARLGELVRGMNRPAQRIADGAGAASSGGSGQDRGTGSATTAGGAATPSGAAATAVPAHARRAGGGARQPAQAGRTAPGAPPQPLTEPEMEFLAGLGPFIGTPRDAKRLFNLYRMLRFSRSLSPASVFLGDDAESGHYQAVAVLLAMLTADPRLLRHVLDAPKRPASDPAADGAAVGGGLMAQPDTGVTWGRFTRSLTPSHTAGSWRNGVIGPIPDADVVAWQRLADAATRTSELVVLRDLSAFRSWAPHVRRFSYLLLTDETG